MTNKTPPTTSRLFQSSTAPGLAGSVEKLKAANAQLRERFLEKEREFLNRFTPTSVPAKARISIRE